jgi:hypothetical protein
VSSLRIRIRASRTDLSTVPGWRRGTLVVDVPAHPIKEDRGTVVFSWPPDGDGRQILKVYGEMGTFNWMRKLVVGYRARREFSTLAVLRAAAVDCCEPLYWGTGRSSERGRFEMIATREVPRAVTLAARAASLAPDERAEVLGRVAEQLARAHAAGVYHGAPFLTNVLVCAAGASASGIIWVDLEKSICFARDIRGSRMAVFDLVNLVNSTFKFMGAGHARAALGRYGLADAEMQRVFAAIDAFRSSKLQRRRRRVEYLVRGVVSRARPNQGIATPADVG